MKIGRRFLHWCFSSSGWLIPIVLVLITAGVLFYRLGEYPDFLYNWEHYTVWRIFQVSNHDEEFKGYLHLYNGLMTESGFSPLVGLPIGLVTQFLGWNLFTMRLYGVLIGILTVVTLWFFARRYWGRGVALTACIVLITNQAFLLYSRTATNVGASLLWSILTIWGLMRVVEKPKDLARYVPVVVLLFVNSFVYAPIRFLLPMTVLVFGCCWFGLLLNQTAQMRRRLLALVTLVFTLIILAMFLGDYFVVVRRFLVDYYAGRGEHIFGSYGATNPIDPHDLVALAQYVFVKNGGNLLRLLLGLSDNPALLDFWNPQGQLISKFIAPLSVIGLVSILPRPSYKSFVLLLWLIFFTLPILLTNNVHVGRLYFALVPLSILVGLGVMWLARLGRRLTGNREAARWAVLMLLIGVVCMVGGGEIKKFFSLNPTKEIVEKTVEDVLVTNWPKIIIANTDPIELRFWESYFYLSHRYEFVDIATGEAILSSTIEGSWVAHVVKSQALQKVEDICAMGLPVVVIGSEREKLVEKLAEGQCLGEVIVQ